MASSSSSNVAPRNLQVLLTTDFTKFYEECEDHEKSKNFYCAGCCGIHCDDCKQVRPSPLLELRPPPCPHDKLLQIRMFSGKYCIVAKDVTQSTDWDVKSIRVYKSNGVEVIHIKNQIPLSRKARANAQNKGCKRCGHGMTDDTKDFCSLACMANLAE